GGLLFDVQQSAKAPDIGGLAWSVFSAILPGDKPSGGAPSSEPAGSSSGKGAKAEAMDKKTATAADPQQKKKKSRGMTVLSDAFSALKGGTSSPPLQPLEQVHTMQLSKGVGRTKLTVFVKDRKKSVFGTIVNMFGTMAGGASTSYLSLLNLGGIA